jgi:hypothetical protein
MGVSSRTEVPLKLSQDCCAPRKPPDTAAKKHEARVCVIGKPGRAFTNGR